MSEQPGDELRLCIEEAAEVWAENEDNREVGDMVKHSWNLGGGTAIVVAVTVREYHLEK